MQQRLVDTKVKDIREVNYMTSNILPVGLAIIFIKQRSVCKVKLVTLSASLNSGGELDLPEGWDHFRNVRRGNGRKIERISANSVEYLHETPRVFTILWI